jgi:hypothetical protein
LKRLDLTAVHAQHRARQPAGRQLFQHGQPPSSHHRTRRNAIHLHSVLYAPIGKSLGQGLDCGIDGGNGRARGSGRCEAGGGGGGTTGNHLLPQILRGALQWLSPVYVVIFLIQACTALQLKKRPVKEPL